MKRLFLFIVLSIMGGFVLSAQEHEYVPFVREGVKWVCYYDNVGQYSHIDSYFNPGRNYFTLEIKGDTIMDGKVYKAMHKYCGESINCANDTILMYLREENKIVYGISPNKHDYIDFLIGYGDGYGLPNIYDDVFAGREIILYDFNDPIGFCSDILHLHSDNFGFISSNYLDLGEDQVKRYLFSYLNGYFFIIEGIGFDGYENVPGYTLGYLFNSEYPIYQLSHVVKDGEIIYKSANYEGPQHDVGDDYEYVPFVREGVKWVYYYYNPFDRDLLGIDEGVQYYSFEMKGDYEIGGKHYKQVSLTHYLDDDTKEVEPFIPVYLREENKIVYAFHPDGMEYPQCPVGIGRNISYNYQPATTTDEFVLYDFNDPVALYDSISISEQLGSFADYQYTDTVKIANYNSKRHHYISWGYNNSVIIEGIGYNGDILGTPLFCFPFGPKNKQVEYYLSHVVENGEIIYKTVFYSSDIHVGIAEVVTDKSRRPMDPQYYNLMGQPVGTDVPTAPGIYIHQGRKIVVR